MADQRRPEARPTPLSELLKRAVSQLRPTNPQGIADGILFVGNRHEAVPRSLLTDARLTPIERNTWLILRILLDDAGVNAMPTYAQLRPYLSTVPCGGVASDETIARALTVLRLARWLTLVSRQRDPETGRIRGNLYVLHDAPLMPAEVIQLDPEYLTLVSGALTHASRNVQRVGRQTISDVVEDPHLAGRMLPTRLQALAAHLVSQPWARPTPEEEPSSDSEVRAPSSESEDGKTPHETPLRNPKTATVRKYVLNTSHDEEVRTVPRAREAHGLRLPEPFDQLKPEQQAGALEALRRVAPELQQAVLDEWSMRCRETTVRNPAGYLFGVVQAALRGDFNAYAGRRRRR